MERPRAGGNERASLFDAKAPHCLTNWFTGDTMEEMVFAVHGLVLTPGVAVLDVGYCMGRYSVGLARIAFDATGVDISGGMLREAAKTASAAGVQVE